MADVDTVRLIIADPQQFARDVLAADGVQTQFLTKNAPLVDTTLLAWVQDTPTAPASVEVRTGLVTFAAPPPADVEAVTLTYRWSVLLDEDITEFLTLEAGNIKLAAAQALDTIASSEVMIQKRITLLDLQTDGPATARELRAHATALRKQVEAGTAETDAEGMIDIAEMVLPPFTGYPYWKYKKELEEYPD